MDNYSKDVLSEIQERAFSEGYNQALIEKMYAEEGNAKEKEAILDRLKKYGGKVKDLAWGDKWEGNKLRRGVTIGTGAAAAAGTLAYLKHKKAKAEAAAEALEEAAEAQREYSAILAERIYSEEEEKGGYGKAAARGALGAAGVAGLGYGVGKGIQALNNRKLKKLDALVEAATDPDMEKERMLNKTKYGIESKLNKASGAVARKEAALAELWNSGKAGKAKILGAAGLALGAGAGIGAGVKKLKDKKNED